MDIVNVENFLGFNTLQTALEDGNQLIKELTPIKFKYSHKRKLVIRFLNSLIITMNRREINWRLNHKFLFIQCLEIFSRAALQLGVGVDFVCYIDELWVPIQKDNFVFTIKTPPWAIEVYVKKILSIITNVEDNKKRDKLFIQIGSPILNVLLLQPSFEVQVVMWNALNDVLNKVSNVKNTFMSLLRNFPNHDKAMRDLIESYFQTITFTPAQSRQLVRALNLNCDTFKIYTLICTSIAINNIFILPCDGEFYTYANFTVANKSISLHIKKNDLNIIFGEPIYLDDNINDILYIYFDCIRTISYYPHNTNASLTCIEIQFTNCFPLCYRENDSLKKLCCTVSMNEEQLAIFLKMLQNFQIDNKLKLNNGPKKIFTGISVQTTGDNVSPDIIHPSARSDDNLTMTRKINISEPDILKTRTFKGTVFNKALDNYNVLSSTADKTLAKKRKLITTSTPIEGSPNVSERSTNRTPTKRRRLTKHLCIALSEQPEPVSFAININQNSQIVSNIIPDEVVPETVYNSENERNIGNKSIEELSRPQTNSIMSNDSFSLRTNSDLEKQIESPVENRSSVNYVVSTTSNDSFSCSNLEKGSQCSQRIEATVNKNKQLDSPNDSFSQGLAEFSQTDVNSAQTNGEESSVCSQQTISQQSKSRIVQIRSQDYSVSSNSVNEGTVTSKAQSLKSSEVEGEHSDQNTTSVISEIGKVQDRNGKAQSLKLSQVDDKLLNRNIFVLVSKPNNTQDRSVINAKRQSSKSSQLRDKLSDKNTSCINTNGDKMQNKNAIKATTSSQTKGGLSDTNTSSAVANPEEIQASLVVASSQESTNALTEPQWQCGKHFSMLTPSSSSNTQSTTENVTDGYTQHMQKLYAELNKFTETTTMNQQNSTEIHNKAMHTILNVLNSYNVFWCEQNQNFKERFERDQDVFKDLSSKL